MTPTEVPSRKININSTKAIYVNSIPISRSPLSQAAHSFPSRSSISPAPHKRRRHSQVLVGSYERSLLFNASSRGNSPFIAKIGAIGGKSSIIPAQISIKFSTSFNQESGNTPYAGVIDVGQYYEGINGGSRGYKIPKKGKIQILVKHDGGAPSTSLKIFLVEFDLSSLEKNATTFLNQKIYDSTNGRLLSAIHLFFASLPVDEDAGFRTKKPKSRQYVLTGCIRLVFSMVRISSQEQVRIVIETPESSIPQLEKKKSKGKEKEKEIELQNLAQLSLDHRLSPVGSSLLSQLKPDVL